MPPPTKASDVEARLGPSTCGGGADDGHLHGAGGGGHDHHGHGHAHGGHDCADNHAGPPRASSAAAEAALLAASDGAARRRGDGASLAAEFARGEALYHHVVDGDALAGCGGSGAHAHDESAHVAEGVSALLAAARLVRDEGIFSPNETLDDIHTGDLRYLLVEFFLGGLRARTPDVGARARALTDARAGLAAFIADVVRRGVLPRSEAAAVGMGPFLDDERGDDSSSSSRRAGRDDVDDGGDADADDGGGASSSVASARAAQIWAQAGARVGASSRAPTSAAIPSDPAAARAQKIERFKRNTAAKKRLKELALLHARLARLNGGDTEADAADGVGSAASLAGGVFDEDARREMTLLALQSAARSAVDEIASIDQELPLLRHRAAQQAAAAAATSASSSSRAAASSSSAATAIDDARMSPTERQRAAAAAYAAAGPPPDDPSINPARKGLEVMRIAPTFEATREVVKAGVFTSSHRPPTMSFEEWGDIVTEKRVAREAREAVQSAGRVKGLAELEEAGIEAEDDAEAYEAAQVKARRFDDWADGVPKGSGVTKRV